MASDALPDAAAPALLMVGTLGREEISLNELLPRRIGRRRGNGTRLALKVARARLARR